MGDRFLVTPARGTAGKGKVFWLAPREGGGGEDYSANFIRGGSAPGSAPLPFYIPFLTERVPLSYTFY